MEILVLNFVVKNGSVETSCSQVIQKTLSPASSLWEDGGIKTEGL